MKLFVLEHFLNISSITPKSRFEDLPLTLKQEWNDYRRTLLSSDADFWTL